MIPYFELRSIPLGGGRSLAVFGLLVAIGVIAGLLFARSRARALGVPAVEINAAITWALIPGFILSHVVALCFYQTAWVDRSALRWLEIWNGMSSFGGFAGALLGLALFLRRRPESRLVITEILIQALIVGWIFGRLGCSLVHDHIGQPTDFFLAIRFPDGPRHDLGLYELLYTLFVLAPAVLLLNRRPRLGGTTVAVICLLYAVPRFLADFLRNTDLPGADPRYLGLTAAQYGCIALFAVGIAFARRLHTSRRAGL